MKIIRASEHLQTLDQEVVRFLESNPYILTPQAHMQGDKHVTEVLVEVTSQPAKSLGLLVGDYIHNVRSALDYLAYELMGKVPANQRVRSQFPIVRESAAKYRESGWPLVAPLPGRQRKIIRGLQPYQRGDASKDHPLAILNALSNRDKHRLLPLTVAQVNYAAAHISGADIVAVYDVRHHVGPVKDKAKLLQLTYTTTPGVKKPDVHVKGNITMDIGLADGRPVRQTLLDIGLFVEAVIEFFAPVL